MQINNVRISNNMFQRLRGLIGSEPLKKNEAMLICKCNAIHTMFMRYSIDAIFLDNHMNIIGIENDIKPWSKSKFYPKASCVLEILSQKNNLSVGDQLSWLKSYCGGN